MLFYFLIRFSVLCYYYIRTCSFTYFYSVCWVLHVYLRSPFAIRICVSNIGFIMGSYYIDTVRSFQSATKVPRCKRCNTSSSRITSQNELRMLISHRKWICVAWFSSGLSSLWRRFWTKRDIFCRFFEKTRNVNKYRISVTQNITTRLVK